MDGRCTATRKDGAACSGTVWKDGWCWFHHPGEAEKRAASRRLGGAGKSNVSRARKQLIAAAMDPSEVVGLLSLTLRRVVAGQSEPGIGNAAANLGKAIVAVREASVVEQRLEALEQALEHAERDRRRWGT